LKIIAKCVVVITILTLSIKPVYAKRGIKESISHQHKVSIKVGRAKKPRTLQQYIDRLCTKDCVESSNLKLSVTQASTKHHVPRHLILAVMKVESRFKKKAKSKGNYGLMQVNASTHPELTGDKFNVKTNIDAGTSILKDCLTKTKGVVKRALSCYKGNESPIYIAEVITAMNDVRGFQYN